MLFQKRWQLPYGHPVHVRAPFVGLDSFQCLLAVFSLAELLHQLFGDGRAFDPALPRRRFGPFREALRGFTPIRLQEGQHLQVLLPLVVQESRCLLTAPITLLAEDRLGLHPLPDYYARC
jgi:hypothetical protein